MDDPSPDLIGLFIEPLNALGFPYMVTGAAAAIVYGEPRMTRDIDVVVDLAAAAANRIAGTYPEPAYYVPPAEVIGEATRAARGGHFNVIHVPSALKADFYIAGTDPLHAWGMARRLHQVAGGVPIWLAPPEYVIVRKLEWYRDGGVDAQLRDVRGMLRVSGDHIDSGEIDRWASRLSLTREWALARDPRGRRE